ncbi:GTP binding protein Gtp1 [Histomonas meleagridis]|uniref:GTP binding protein Gtp1 n=1 Tax=Histomonas meleagridis TaxID=135588 RepID=UPI003559D961|nr:GTP binding protein Gtp1 [Histomonas meleagridis]KAH0806744.1 GTP binding protein Gtp1 [Histomonas meleagridis]
MGIQERIADIEKELSRTQINKATERHLGMLKSQLVHLRAQLIEEAQKTNSGGPQFDVARTGDARVCLFGFPSVGKSSLLSKLTDYESPIGDYDFTTVTAVPAILEVNGVKIQLLDLPGILQGASSGYGKGRQVLGVVRSCDLIVYVIDSAKADMEIKTLTEELHSFGIRVNDEPPNVVITPLVRGGVVIDTTVPQTHMDDEMLRSIATANRFRSGHILIREDITVDRFIDAFHIKNLKYIPAMFIYNKIDTLTIEEIDRLAHLPRSVVTSVIYNLNLDCISQMIYKMLNITRVYTKPQGEPPDFEEAVLLRNDTTVRALCMHIHRDLVDDFKGAQVWGSSVKRPGQIVGLSHCLQDEDVVCIKTNKN